MEVVFFFKNMSLSEEEQLREYFLTKAPQIEKMLTHFPNDGARLQVKGERFKKHSAYDVELVMKLPKEILQAREASHMITKAVDLAKDRLQMQLKKSILQMRRGHRSVKVRSKMKLRMSTIGSL